MSEHDCPDCYADYGDCPTCVGEAMAEAARAVFGARGRWLVVHADGSAWRYARRRYARSHQQVMRRAGMQARIIRYGRKRVERDYHAVELRVTDARWRP